MPLVVSECECGELCSLYQLKTPKPIDSRLQGATHDEVVEKDSKLSRDGIISPKNRSTLCCLFRDSMANFDET
jgi:hypothetical protein